VCTFGRRKPKVGTAARRAASQYGLKFLRAIRVGSSAISGLPVPRTNCPRFVFFPRQRELLKLSDSGILTKNLAASTQSSLLLKGTPHSARPHRYRLLQPRIGAQNRFPELTGSCRPSSRDTGNRRWRMQGLPVATAGSIVILWLKSASAWNRGPHALGLRARAGQPPAWNRALDALSRRNVPRPHRSVPGRRDQDAPNRAPRQTDPCLCYTFGG